MKLTARQQRFADMYIISGNAAEAARKAGYSPKTADRIAHQNLKKVVILEYIEQHLQQQKTEVIADQTEILEMLTHILRNDKIEAKDRIRAAELLGRRYLLWNDTRKQEADLKKAQAETELLQVRTQLLQGAAKDTSLLEALIKTIENK